MRCGLAGARRTYEAGTRPLAPVAPTQCSQPSTCATTSTCAPASPWSHYLQAAEDVRTDGMAKQMQTFPGWWVCF